MPYFYDLKAFSLPKVVAIFAFQSNDMTAKTKETEVIIMANELKVTEKYTLSVKEASEYFGIGTKQMRSIAENNEGEFAFLLGNRYLIIRPKFEQYLLELAARKENPYEEPIG